MAGRESLPVPSISTFQSSGQGRTGDGVRPGRIEFCSPLRNAKFVATDFGLVFLKIKGNFITLSPERESSEASYSMFSSG
jgi:hypothetical protein